MGNALQGVVGGLQALGGEIAKHWFLTGVLPLVAAGVAIVVSVALLIPEFLKDREQS
jgi:hypothetical protein